MFSEELLTLNTTQDETEDSSIFLHCLKLLHSLRTKYWVQLDPSWSLNTNSGEDTYG